MTVSTLFKSVFENEKKKNENDRYWWCKLGSFFCVDILVINSMPIKEEKKMLDRSCKTLWFASESRENKKNLFQDREKENSGKITNGIIMNRIMKRMSALSLFLPFRARAQFENLFLLDFLQVEKKKKKISREAPPCWWMGKWENVESEHSVLKRKYYTCL